jgi:hypothetical protein
VILGGGRMARVANNDPVRRSRRASSTMKVHVIKVVLRGARPPIWRRLEVPSESTLEQVHHTIQEAFGWAGYHLWVFETLSGEYGLADPELGHRSAASRTLRQVAPNAGSRLRYTYDFGDGWDHDVSVEKVTAAEPGIAYPRCLTGRRACPPEDCGGIWGYEELIEVLSDPGHDEHEERLEWLGLDSAQEFDPAAFDLAEVNAALARLATVLVDD